MGPAIAAITSGRSTNVTGAGRAVDSVARWRVVPVSLGRCRAFVVSQFAVFYRPIPGFLPGVVVAVVYGLPPGAKLLRGRGSGFDRIPDNNYRHGGRLGDVAGTGVALVRV